MQFSMFKALVVPAIVALTLGSALSFANHHETVEKKKPDIVDVAVSAGQFKTLVAALTAADLAKVLKGDGPFTVMAPNDAAFAKLPEGTVEDLLKPENNEKLVAILTYHVIPGAVSAADALKAKKAKTVQGGTLTFAVVTKDGRDQAQVNGVDITKTDIEASNGVIHVINQVLMPPAK
ncbi:MAG: fasciclin domain-containing protein [Phycisphaeraceae bacterium]